MRGILNIVENLPFSEHEIMTLVDHKANLVLYPDIANYSSIDELLGKHKACIILYVTSMNNKSVFGHWTCLFKINKNTLEWFDPYALVFDSEFALSPIKYPPYLTKLLERSNYNVIYNTHKLQNIKKPNVATCGRHVGLRLQFRAIPIQSYAEMLQSIPGLSPDDIVTLMTAFIK